MHTKMYLRSSGVDILISSLFHSEYVHIAVIIVGCVCSFLTLYLIENSPDNYFNLSETELQLSLSSKRIQELLLFTVAVNLPMGIDLVIDIRSTYYRFNAKSFNLWFSQVILVFSLILPNFFLYLISDDDIKNSSEILALLFSCSSCFRQLSALSSILFYLHTVVGGIWNSKVCITLSILYGVSLICGCYSLISVNGSQNLGTFSTIGILCSYLLFIYMCFQWGRQLYSSRGSNSRRSLAPETYCGLVYVTALIAVSAALLIVFSSFGEFDSFYYSEDIVAWTLYIQAAFCCIVTIFPGRVSRAEAANKSFELENRKVFIRYISHEIRTPMNTILLGLQYLQRNLDTQKNLMAQLHVACQLVFLGRDIPSEISKYFITEEEGGKDLSGGYDLDMQVVADIREACTVSLDILNDLLAFDKLESGNLALDKKLESAVSFFTDVIKPFYVQAKEAKVKLEVKCGRNEEEEETIGLLLVDIDKFKLSQVVRNLVSNALKFSMRGESAVTILLEVVDSEAPSAELAATAEGGSFLPLSHAMSRISPKVAAEGISHLSKLWLRFSVTDTGPGIALENQGKIFKEVIQFNPNELQGGGGSGLGLYISNGIVRLHGGRIGFKSDGLGFGCTFYFDIEAQKNVRRRPSIAANETSNISRIANAVQANLDSRRIKETSADRSADNSFILSPSNIQSFCSNTSFNTESSQLTGLQQNARGEALHPQIKAPPIERRKLSVLIVDDSDLNRKMLLRLLKGDAFECCEANDGEVAVEIISSLFPENEPLLDAVHNVDADSATLVVKKKARSPFENIDIILMDYIMGHMHGPAACKEIRKLGFKGIIFGVTGNVLPVDIATFVDNGANQVLSKPLSIDALYAAMEVELNSRPPII